MSDGEDPGAAARGGLLRRIGGWDRRLGEQAWRSSVVRRATMLLFIVAPGLILNFLLSVVTAQILPPAVFGTFYLGLAVSSMFAAPSVILSFFLARRVAAAYEAGGQDAVWRIAPALIRRTLAMVAAIGGLALVVAALGGLAMSVTAPWLVPIIALLAVSFYLVDIARGLLNGMHRFLALGLVGTAWMAGRFGFGVAGAWLTGTVWISLLGVALAGFAVAGAFFAAVTTRLRRTEAAAAAASETAVPADATDARFRELPTFALGYGLAFAIAYQDVLLGYVLLDREALGAYAASAVLPKGVFTLTLPIVQVMFASLIGRADGPGGAVLRRTLLMTAALTAAAGLVMWVGQDAVCGGAPWRIGSCEPGILGVMAVSVVAISLLRCLVAARLARGRLRHPLWLIASAAGYAAYALWQQPEGPALAVGFTLFAFATLVLYGALCAVDARRR